MGRQNVARRKASMSARRIVDIGTLLSKSSAPPERLREVIGHLEPLS